MKIAVLIVLSAIIGAAFSWYINQRMIATLRGKIRAMKAGKAEPVKRRLETSKKLVLATGVIFGASVVVGIMASTTGMDMTFFIAEIGIAGGVFGSSIVSYEIKAKMENVVKLKMGIIKFRLAIGRYLTPEQMALVEADIQALEASIDGKIDDTIAQVINQDPEIPNY